MKNPWFLHMRKTKTQTSLIRVFTVRLKIDRILSYSLSAQWRLWPDWASAHCRLIWIFAGLTCQFVGFCHDAAQIMAELFLEMTQWKDFMSASAGVQVLDFTKSLVYSNCQNDRKCCFFFVCFFFLLLLLLFFFRSMYAFYHLYVCLSFRVDLMLCINYL